jgi:hypothetical protein
MNKIRLLYILVFGLIIANILFFIRLSTPGFPPRPPHRGDPKHLIAEELHFDANQRTHFEELAQKHHQRIKVLEDSLIVAKENYYNASLKPSTDSTTTALLEKITSLHREIERVNVAHFWEIKSLCKGDQIQDFERMLPRFANFFRNAGPPPPPPHDE